MKGNTTKVPIPDKAELGQEVASRLEAYVGSLLCLLDKRLDVRLVRTFAATLVNIIRHRNRALSLILTELGELLTDGAKAPAGVKRLYNLLHSPKWAASLVSDSLLADADQAVEAAVAKDGVAHLALDGSEIEKPTAEKMEGLTKVRSANAALLLRASGGPPPKRPVMVPGFNWVGAVITGLTGNLTLARLHWYSTKAPGDQAQKQREAEWFVLKPLLERWGQKVICLLDRGFDSHPFLGQLLAGSYRLIVRWRHDLQLIGPNGESTPAGQLTKRLRSKWFTEVYEPRRRQMTRLGVVAIPVQLWDYTDYAGQLWLVAVRRKGKGSWWFLTTEDCSTEQGALRVVLAYARRWQVEWAFRYGKSELGLASIRVLKWEHRAKLWAIAELAYAFLIHLLLLDDGLVSRILRWCHRTGRRWAKVISPLYRLRHALVNLWNDHPPKLACYPHPSTLAPLP